MAQAKSMPAMMIGELEDDAHEKCCDSPSIIDRYGSFVCQRCGIVHERVIIPEHRRAFNTLEINQRRQDAVMASHFSGTVMANSGFKKRPSPERVAEMARLVRVNNTIGRTTDRSLITYYRELKNVIVTMSGCVPEHVASTAREILAMLAKMKIARGRTVTSMTRATLYYAFKVQRIAAMRHEFYGNMDKREFTSACRVLHDIITKKYCLKSIPFRDYIIRAANLAGMSHESIIAVLSLYRQVPNRKEFFGKSPSTIIGALFYVACKEKTNAGMYITQSFVAARFNVTEVSIRNRAREILNMIKRPDPVFF